MGVAVTDPSPAFDPREESLDARAIPAPPGSLRERCHHGASCPDDRHQIFRARENENVRLFPIPVLRETLVHLARNRRNPEAPAKAKWTVSRTGIVGQGQTRTKTGAACAGRNRYSD